MPKKPNLKHPPGPSRLTAWLDNTRYPNKHIVYPQELIKKYGDIIKLPTMRKTYLIMNPQAIEQIARNNMENYIKVSSVYGSAERIFGTSILTSEGDVWRSSRRDLQKAFYKKQLTEYFQIMRRNCKTQLNKWQSIKKGSIVNIGQDLTKLALQNSITCQLDHQDTAFFTNNINKLSFLMRHACTEKFICIPNIGNTRFHYYQRIIKGHLQDIIRTKVSSKSQTGILAHLKLDCATKKEEQILINNIYTMVFAGFETAACLLRWTIYFLAQIPELQHGIRQQLNSLPGGLTYNNVAKCELLNACIDEVMRLYPPIWSTARKAVHNDKVCNYHIPANANIIINFLGLHRNPKLWQEPNLFLPHRFFNEERNKIARFNYLPFGTGQHQCIASHFAMLEVRTILAGIIMNFDITNCTRGKINSLPYISLVQDKDLLIKLIRV